MARVSFGHAPAPEPLRREPRKHNTNGPIAPQIPALRAAFQSIIREKAAARAIDDPAGTPPQTHISAWNLLNCHGT